MKELKLDNEFTREAMKEKIADDLVNTVEDLAKSGKGKGTPPPKGGGISRSARLRVLVTVFVATLSGKVDHARVYVFAPRVIVPQAAQDVDNFVCYCSHWVTSEK